MLPQQFYCSTCSDKLDRLGWADGIIVDAFGLRVGIRVSDSGSLSRVRDLVTELGWPLLDNPASDLIFSVRIGTEPARKGVRHFHLLYVGTLRLLRTLEEEKVWSVLNSTLQAYILANSPKYSVLRASSIVFNERAIVLPGHGPDSPLLDAVVKAGAEIFSEQWTLVGEQGTIAPYPQLAEPRRATDIAFLEKGGRIRGLRPRTLSPAKASLHLLMFTLNTRANPERTLAGLTKLASSGSATWSRHACDKTAAIDLLSFESKKPSRIGANAQ